MKCIDAIEGTVKSILNQWHGLCVEHQLEDSEYVRNVKSVIDGTGLFLAENPEVVENPQLLLDELYSYSRELWLGCQQGSDDTGIQTTPPDAETLEYHIYFYDYLYHRGIYPR